MYHFTTADMKQQLEPDQVLLKTSSEDFESEQKRARLSAVSLNFIGQKAFWKAYLFNLVQSLACCFSSCLVLELKWSNCLITSVSHLSFYICLSGAEGGDQGLSTRPLLCLKLDQCRWSWSFSEVFPLCGCRRGSRGTATSLLQTPGCRCCALPESCSLLSLPCSAATASTSPGLWTAAPSRESPPLLPIIIILKETQDGKCLKFIQILKPACHW